MSSVSAANRPAARMEAKSSGWWIVIRPAAAPACILLVVRQLGARSLRNSRPPRKCDVTHRRDGHGPRDPVMAAHNHQFPQACRPPGPPLGLPLRVGPPGACTAAWLSDPPILGQAAA